MMTIRSSVAELFLAWKFMWATKKRRLLVLAPVLLNLLIWVAVIPVAYIFAAWATSLALPAVWWATVLTVLAGFFAVLATVIFAVFLFVALTTIIGAPFYGELAEEAMRDAGMIIKESPWYREVGRALTYTMKLGVLFVILQFLLVLFNIIPGIGTVLHLVGAFVVSIVLLAMEFFGEAFAKSPLSFRSRLRFLVRHHLSIIAFAVPVFFLLLIPGFNLIVPPLAVVTASRLFCGILAENKLTPKR